MAQNQRVNAIRILAADAVQAANSGHPGFPLGAAPIVYELYAHQMKHSPSDPNWINRDRFILSAGHGSAMLYATLHLFGYPKLDIEALKDFRQLDSLTPGHPEYGHTPGVDASTGPLGAGLGMAVGMAIAETHLAAKYNKDDIKIFDHHTFALSGEGCLMEGISSEVLSLAGTLGLSKLIILFDSNDITIEGSSDLAFTENVVARMASFGFGTWVVKDGNNPEEIGAAIAEAKADTLRPSFIKIKTTIGHGVPDRAGTAKSHGEPIGEANIPILRENLEWPYGERFFVPDDIYADFKALAEEGNSKKISWQEDFEKYAEKYSTEALELSKDLSGEIDEGIFTSSYFDSEQKDDATRSSSGRIINELAKNIPNLIGGSADLAPSNKTEIKEGGYFSKDDRLGRNIHYGVREVGMTAIGNGILLHGGLRTFVSTFFVFADYMKPMLRLSALMGLPLISVLTHDSIGVGEDGPTHQPVEQLTMLRATPNLNVWRPADDYETRVAWKSAILTTDKPTALVLSRQNLPVLTGSGPLAEYGGYILERESGESPDLIIIASGSEVAIALEAKGSLEESGHSVRVVSMPSTEVFDTQSDEYKESVLPKEVNLRIAVEAGSSLSWGKYVGPLGAYISMDTFGASAPASDLFKKFGFTKEHIVEVARALLTNA
jgi:transketolase